MSTHYNNVAQTVSSVASSGTGTITLGAAVTGAQSLGTATGGANATVDIYITEGTTKWEVCRNCTYTHSGTTVDRGTLEAGSNGASRETFTSAAVVRVAATADNGRRWDAAALEHVTGTDAATSMLVNTLYVVDLSTWAANRTYTLPATAAVGDRVGIMVQTGSATRHVALTAASGDALNAVAGGTEWSRLFIAGEVVICRCTVANTTWMVEQDDRIAMRCFARLSTSATGESAGVDTFPTDRSGVWTSVLDVGGIFTASTGTITPRRACRANIAFTGNTVNGVADTQYYQMGITVSGAVAIAPYVRSSTSAGYFVQGSVQSYDLAAATPVRLFYNSGQGSIGLRGDATITTSFGFQEVF